MRDLLEAGARISKASMKEEAAGGMTPQFQVATFTVPAKP